MLPKSRRLTRHDFLKDHREGYIVHSTHLSVRCTPKVIPNNRFSAVISKKVASSSPDRHLWKRRIYEIVGNLEKQKPFPPAVYVFFAKKGSTKLSYKTLMEEVKSLFQQVVKK